jgi:hypothetical protein
LEKNVFEKKINKTFNCHGLKQKVFVWAVFMKVLHDLILQINKNDFKVSTSRRFNKTQFSRGAFQTQSLHQVSNLERF